MLQDGSDPAAVEAAAAILAAGGLLAFPTETVYGLGARADDDAAVGRIFALKGRPSGHPLIVHLAEASDAAAFAIRMPESAERLVAAFWPGPLTVIVPRRPGIAAAAAGGQDTVGLRCPAHPVARALLRAARRLAVPGVAAPSANRFGKVSPTLAAHVVAAFGASLAVLDGGACRVGIESTIVDCSRRRPVLLRPGVLTRAAIEAAAGEPLAGTPVSHTVAGDAGYRPNAETSRDPGPEPAPRAPGTLAAHYAPRARLRLMATPMLHAALQLVADQPLGLAVYSRTVPIPAAGRLRHRRMPTDATSAAHELFAVLHELDEEGAQLIWVEEPPPGPAWDGVRDRLQRAASSH